mmetsp:Transcript_26749/g.74969  ORF Transcript_26749/g.74969 Transcript_26749/m.74969 type:complete len:258 (-) Transcript_26749:62-835(-)
MRAHEGMPHQKFDDEVTVADGIQGVGRHAIEAQFVGQEFAVDAERVSGQGAGSERALVGTRDEFLQSLRVAHQRCQMAQQPMGVPDWLGRLQMRVAGHENVDVLLCVLGTRLQQHRHVLHNFTLGLDQPKARIGGNLVIAGSAGVELSADGSDDLGQSTFVGGVDILITRFELERSVGPFLLHLFQSGDQLLDLLVGDDSDLSDGLGVRDGSANILRPHALVDADALVELFHDGIGASLESAACAEQASAGSGWLLS